ncbi:GIY-YIG nuclease family protein [Roseinatronobacter bogoriensis]
MTGQGPAASESFTYSLSPDFRGILCPDLLIAPADLEAEIERRKVKHGVDAWWFDAELEQVTREGCVQLGTHHMLYIGIAQPMRADVGTRRLTPIRRRLLRNHLHGSIRRSTLRQSLAAMPPAGLAGSPSRIFTVQTVS